MTSRSTELFPRYAFASKTGGGGGGGGGTTVSSTPPPPSVTSVEVQQAKRDAKKQAGKRKGTQSTILAGETGGVNPMASGSLGSSAPDQRKNTLLGSA